MTEQQTPDLEPDEQYDGDPPQVTIFVAWNRVMREAKVLRKERLNKTPGQNFKFRGVDDVVNLIGPALRKHGVILAPVEIPVATYAEVHSGKARTEMGQSKVTVVYRAWGPTGDHIDFSAPGEAFDSGDKATPKAMSVALRTVLLQALMLPTDTADPDETSYDRRELGQQAQQQPTDDQWTAAKDNVWTAICRMVPADPDNNNSGRVNRMRELMHRDYGVTELDQATYGQWVELGLNLKAQADRQEAQQ